MSHHKGEQEDILCNNKVGQSDEMLSLSETTRGLVQLVPKFIYQSKHGTSVIKVKNEQAPLATCSPTQLCSNHMETSIF